MKTNKRNNLKYLRSVVYLTFASILIVLFSYVGFSEYQYEHLVNQIEKNDEITYSQLNEKIKNSGFEMFVNEDDILVPITEYVNTNALQNVYQSNTAIAISYSYNDVKNEIYISYEGFEVTLIANDAILVQFLFVVIIAIFIISAIALLIILGLHIYTRKTYVEPMYDLTSTLVKLKRVDVVDPSSISEVDRVVSELNKKVDDYLEYRNNIISIITHELKSPLNVISSVLLSRNYNLAPFDNEAEVHAEINKQINYMLSVIDTTLNIFEKEEYEATTFQANDIIVEQLEKYKNIFDANDFTINFENTEVFLITGNKDIFNIVINNIFDNVAKYGEKSFTIFISSSQIRFINDVKSESKSGTQVGLKLSMQILNTMSLSLAHQYLDNEYHVIIKK